MCICVCVERKKEKGTATFGVNSGRGLALKKNPSKIVVLETALNTVEATLGK